MLWGRFIMGKSKEVRLEKLLDLINTLVEGKEYSAESTVVSTQKLISHSIDL